MDFTNPELQEAALKIQAGILGYMVRKQRHDAFADDFDVPNEGDQDVDEPDAAGLSSLAVGQMSGPAAVVPERHGPGDAAGGHSGDGTATDDDDAEIDFTNPEIQEAALKIQAGIKGLMVRQQLQQEHPGDAAEESGEESGDHEETEEEEH